MTTRDNCKYYALFTLERGMFVKFPIFLSFDSYTFDEKFSCRNINCPFTYIFFSRLRFSTIRAQSRKEFRVSDIDFRWYKKKRKNNRKNELKTVAHAIERKYWKTVWRFYFWNPWEYSRRKSFCVILRFDRFKGRFVRSRKIRRENFRLKMDDFPRDLNL